MLLDQRTNPVWNPSKPNLKTQLAADNSKLANFRKKFSVGETDSAQFESDLDELMSGDAQQVTTGRVLIEKKKEKGNRRRR